MRKIVDIKKAKDLLVHYFHDSGYLVTFEFNEELNEYSVLVPYLPTFVTQSLSLKVRTSVFPAGDMVRVLFCAD